MTTLWWSTLTGLPRSSYAPNASVSSGWRSVAHNLGAVSTLSAILPPTTKVFETSVDPALRVPDDILNRSVDDRL